MAGKEFISEWRKQAPFSEGDQGSNVSQEIDRIARMINGDPSRPDAHLEFWHDAQRRAAVFRTEYQVPQNIMTRERLTRLGNWIEQDQQTENPQLTQVASVFIRLWDKVNIPGNPAHDKRHLQEDLKAGLTYNAALAKHSDTDPEILRYQRASLIGSLMHDFGRVVETRVFGSETGGEMGKDHPLMSFAIVADILKHFPDIPKELREDLLYSVLAHQDWLTDPKAANYSYTMYGLMPRAVMSADRLQLVGPEGIGRFFQHDVGLDGKVIATTPDAIRASSLDAKTNRSVLLHTEFYMRNLLPVFVPETLDQSDQTRALNESQVIMKANKEIVTQGDRFKAISGVFLKIVAPDALAKQIFAPEIQRGANIKIDEDELAKGRKKPLKPVVWEEIEKQFNDSMDATTVLGKAVRARINGKGLAVLAQELVTAPNMAWMTDEIRQIQEKLGEVNEKEAQERLVLGFGYILVKRDEIDREHAIQIQDIQQRSSEKTLEGTLARFIARQSDKAIQVG